MDDDEARLERLHAEHAGAVRAFVRRRIDEDVDDVVADVFVIAWRKLDAVPDDARIWLLGVARRVLANRRRGVQRRRALTERLVREAERGTLAADNPAGGGVGDEGVALLRALAALRPRDREVLLLVTWDGLGHAEAAAVLGVRPATLTMRVHRARRRLEQALEAPPPAPSESFAGPVFPLSIPTDRT